MEGFDESIVDKLCKLGNLNVVLIYHSIVINEKWGFNYGGEDNY